MEEAVAYLKALFEYSSGENSLMSMFASCKIVQWLFTILQALIERMTRYKRATYLYWITLILQLND
jgi:hypothetical protein